MKISPAMKEFLVPGMRTGNKPAPMVSTRAAPICSQAQGERVATSTRLQASAAAPSTTTIHQKTVAPRL